MSGKDANRRFHFGKTWAVVACGFVLLGVAVVAVRQTQGPAVAEAQAPRGVAPQARQLPGQPTQRVATVPGRQVATTSAEGVPTPAPKNLQTVAVVNREPISRDDLAKETLRRHGEEVLETLVNKKLILMECEKHGIQITEKDIDAEIENIAKKFGLSVDRWMTLLQEERQVSQGQYRREIIWPTLALRRLAASRLEVSKEELQQEWEKHYGPKVQVRMISVANRALAEELYEKAKANPESFADLAKDFSQDPNSAAARGLIPPIRKHTGDKAVEELVFGMQPGEISKVVFTANQYLIFNCVKHLPEQTPPSAQLTVIQDRLRDMIREGKMREAASDIYQQLQESAKIENIFNDPQKAASRPDVAAILNGQPITLAQLQEECISRFGVEVLDGEINRKLLKQELTKRGMDVSEEDLEAEISRAADAFGFLTKEGHPDLEAWLNQVTDQQKVSVELYIRDAVWPTVALKKLVGDKIQVSEDDLRKGFVANYGERVQVLAIVLDNQRRAQEVWEQARRNPSEEFFGELAAQYSIEPVSKNNDGQVPPLRRYGGQPALEEEAFRLSEGELSGIVAMGKQYVVLKCLGKTKPLISDMEDVRDELFKDIHEKKIRMAMNDEFDRLREDAQIDNFLANTTQVGKAYETTVRQQMQNQR